MEFYCDGCQRGHKKGKATKSHSFISVDHGWKIMSASAASTASNSISSSSSSSSSNPSFSSQSRSNQCLIHPHQEIDTFCQTDQEPICSKCAVEFHSGHSFKNWENVFKLLQGWNYSIIQSGFSKSQNGWRNWISQVELVYFLMVVLSWVNMEMGKYQF